MKRLAVFLLASAALLAGPACKKDPDEAGNQKKEQEVQTTVETEQSEEKGDGGVKVKVRTPNGDYNVDVQY